MNKTLIITALAFACIVPGHAGDDDTELGVNGVIALANDSSEAPNLYGGMLTFGKTVAEHHQLFLTAGVLSGSLKDNAFISSLSATLSTKTDALSVPVQLGYNYIWNPSDTVSFYTGIRGGFAYNNCDVDISLGRLSHSKAEKSFDPVLGAGLGVHVRLAEHCRLTAGYEFWHMWMDNPALKSLDLPSSSLNPSFHVIKVGLTFDF